MARQHDIQYIRVYTPGSAAHKLEYPAQPAPKPRTQLPKPRPEQVRVVRLEPLAWCAIAVAAVLLVLILVSFVRLCLLQNEITELSRYVDELAAQQQALEQTYHGSYNLLQVYETALELGLVPVDQVTHMPLPLG